MTLLQAFRLWKDTILPVVIYEYGDKDRPARRQSWVDYVDFLVRDGAVPEAQASRWGTPERLETCRSPRIREGS